MKINIQLWHVKYILGSLLLAAVASAVIVSLAPLGDQHEESYRVLGAIPVIQVDRDGNSFTLPHALLDKVVQAKKDFTIRDISPGTEFKGHEMSVMKLLSTDGKTTLYVPVSSHIRRYERLSAGDWVAGMSEDGAVAFKTRNKDTIAVVVDPFSVK